MLKRLVVFLLILHCSFHLSAMESTDEISLFDQLINGAVINDGKASEHRKKGLELYKNDAVTQAKASFFAAAQRGDITSIANLAQLSASERKYEDALKFYELANHLNMIQFQELLPSDILDYIQDVINKNTTAFVALALEEWINSITTNNKKFINIRGQFKKYYDIFIFIQSAMNDTYPLNDLRKQNHFNFILACNFDFFYIWEAIADPIFKAYETARNNKNVNWENFSKSLPPYPFIIKSRENIFNIVVQAIKSIQNNPNSHKDYPINSMLLQLIFAMDIWLEKGDKNYQKIFAEIASPILQKSFLPQAEQVRGNWLMLGLMGAEMKPADRVRMAADIFLKYDMKTSLNYLGTTYYRQGFAADLTDYEKLVIIYDMIKEHASAAAKISMLMDYLCKNPHDDKNPFIKSFLLNELESAALKKDFDPALHGYFFMVYFQNFLHAPSFDEKSDYLFKADKSLKLCVVHYPHLLTKDFFIFLRKMVDKYKKRVKKLISLTQLQEILKKENLSIDKLLMELQTAFLLAEPKKE